MKDRVRPLAVLIAAAYRNLYRQLSSAGALKVYTGYTRLERRPDALRWVATNFMPSERKVLKHSPSEI